MSCLQWRPNLPENELVARHEQIKDWQITHGSLIKLVLSDDGHSVLSQPISVTMFPTPFPQSLFDLAMSLQTVYTRLYVSIAENEDWLREALKDLISTDKLTKALWSIYEEVSQEGEIQPLRLGIFRSDYMLHGGDLSTAATHPALKQVEFNTFSCAGGTHGNIVADMHHHLEKVELSDSITAAKTSRLPQNDTIRSIVWALAKAHEAYTSSRAEIGLDSHEYPLAVLFVVQPNNINICDERPLEHGLWSSNPSVPSFRAEFPFEILTHTSIHGKSRRLLFKPHLTSSTQRVYEISLVYLRAGYDAAEYTEQGIAARLLLERSCAIKCPSILSHVTTFKKVQQALASPGALELVLPPDEITLIRDTFMPMYPLDISELGMRGRDLALNPVTAADYILKPSLEGGGHNVYGAAIPNFLQHSVPEAQWPHYVLQQRIQPPENVHNILLSHRSIYQGNVVSELGIFGTPLWRRRHQNSMNPELICSGIGPLQAGAVGWSFKTKAAYVEEMSVVKGYGCFDCPLLVD